MEGKLFLALGVGVFLGMSLILMGSPSESSTRSSAKYVFQQSKETPPPRTPTRPISSGKRGSSERWAVVQLYDGRGGDGGKIEYVSAILSTNTALRETGMIPRVEHVAYFVRGPNSKPISSNYKTFSLALNALQAVGIKIVSDADVIHEQFTDNMLKQMSSHFYEADRFSNYFYKISTVNMTMFDRILFLDNDVIITQPLLPLFERAAAMDEIRSFETGGQNAGPAIYMVADVATGMCHNSGVMLLSPNSQDFSSMIASLMSPAPGKSYLKAFGDEFVPLSWLSVKRAEWPIDQDGTSWVSTCTGDARANGDQDFIEHYYLERQRLESLPPYYNILVSHHGSTLNKPKDWLITNPLGGGFLMWAFHSPASRSQIKAVHVGWPKPTWPIWQNGENNGASDEQKEKHPKWKDKTKWFIEFAHYGDAGLAFLSLFKTFWSRAAIATESICAISNHGSQTVEIATRLDGKVVSQKLTTNLLVWCSKTRFPRFIGGRMGWYGEKPNGLLVDQDIPLWNDTLTGI